MLKKSIFVQNNRVHAKFLGNMYFQERNTKKERQFEKNQGDEDYRLFIVFIFINFFFQFSKSIFFLNIK